MAHSARSSTGTRAVATALMCMAGVTACVDGRERDTEVIAEESRTVIEVSAIYDAAADEHRFLSSADTVPSGWTTFRFTNASPVLHFVFLDHLPGDRTSEDLLAEVSPVFQESMDLVLAGRADEAPAVFAKLPEWFGELVFRGGPGFASPGMETETVLFLEPGNYVLECYVKTADGVFHWNRGMYVDLHVTDELSDSEPPPNPTLQVTVTDTAMSIEGELTPGDHVVAVHFQEMNPDLFGKDLHVARLVGDADVDELITWMDANQIEGLVSTAEDPAPATFLGGVHDMPFGNTAYFTLRLDPGEYIWISELPAASPSFQRVNVAN